IESVLKEQFPYRLRTIQYATLVNGYFDAGVQALIEAIAGSRPLDPNTPSTGQNIRVSNSFPRGVLDIPLIGRDAELTKIRGWLADSTRTVSILGLGGVGKTRLAAELVNAEMFRDGVLWHTIDANTTVDRLTDALREFLNLDKTVDADGIWAALGKRQTL